MHAINAFLWGGLLLVLLIGTGIYLSVRTRFFQIRRLPLILKETIGSLFAKKEDGKISPFAAMSAALGGTMGTGNIAGVGAALVLGGPGALFWMWISGFLCMIIKFAEVALAVRYREKSPSGEWCGGPMYYIKNGLPRLLPLAFLFCAFTVFASFGIGSAAQSSAASAALSEATGLPGWTIGLALMGLSFACVFGTAKKITTITSWLIPVATAAYMAFCVFLLIDCRENFVPAIRLILSDAFTFSGVAGGGTGFVVSRAMRFGVSRGIFTNEAGMGSAPIVHAAADTNPFRQGCFGAFEVFLDTIVMCTVTGLVVLCSGVYDPNAAYGGVGLTAAAFTAAFGRAGGLFVAVSLALFALGSIVSWSYYGSKCCAFLFKKKAAVTVYRTAFCLAVFGGTVMGTGLVFELSDTLNALMAIPNLIALVLLSPEIRKITESARKPRVK